MAGNGGWSTAVQITVLTQRSRTLTMSQSMREEILKAAQPLFIQHGYHGLAMREIAEAVGLTKAALYYHFRDKESLFLAMLEEYLLAVEVVMDEVETASTDSRDRVRALVQRLLGQPVEQRALIRLASQEIVYLEEKQRRSFQAEYHRRFIQRIENILRSGMEAGELRTMEPRVATWALLGMLYPFFFPAHAQNMPDARQAAEELSAVFLEGMSG